MAVPNEPLFPTDAPRTGSLRRDVVFDLLSSQRRIFVVEFVDEQGPTTLRELRDELAAEENDIPVEQVGTDESKAPHVALYQTHLPRLDGHAVVDYDKDRGTVAPGPNLSDCTDVLDDDAPAGWLVTLRRALGL